MLKSKLCRINHCYSQIRHTDVLAQLFFFGPKHGSEKLIILQGYITKHNDKRSVDYAVCSKLYKSKEMHHHIAYFCVQSLANLAYLSRSVLYNLAISGTRGSSGFGSVNSEQIDSSTEKKNKPTLTVMWSVTHYNTGAL